MLARDSHTSRCRIVLPQTVSTVVARKAAYYENRSEKRNHERYMSPLGPNRVPLYKEAPPTFSPASPRPNLARRLLPENAVMWTSGSVFMPFTTSLWQRGTY